MAHLRHLFFCLLFLQASSAFAQIADWEDVLEILASSDAQFSNADDASHELDELLLSLHESPINLNACDATELMRLPFLSQAQADSIIAFRERYGAFLAVDNLRLVRGLTAQDVMLARHFVTCGVADHFHQPHLQQEAALSLGVPCYRRAGFRNGRYDGIPLSHTLRYRLTKEDRFTAGLTAQTDDGEPIRLRRPFDAMSFYAQWRGNGLLRKVTLGDFIPLSGRGLTLGLVPTSSPLALVTSYRPRAGAVRAHTSVSEYQFLRGASAEFGLSDHLGLMVFASQRPIDAVLRNDSISSMPVTGLHRTPPERNHRYNVTQSAIGATLTAQWGEFSVGATATQAHFSRPLTRTQAFYRRYDPIGRTFANASLHYDYDGSSFKFGGETGIDGNGHLAATHDIRWQPIRTTRIFAQHRLTTRAYYAPLAGMYQRANRGRNEHGILLGTVHQHHAWQWLGYLDAFRCDWATSSADEASTGYALQLRASRPLTPEYMGWEWRYQLSARQSTVDRIGLRYHYRHTWRGRALYQAGRFTLSTSLDGCYYQPSFGQTQWGYMVSQKAKCSVKGTDLSAVAAWFHTDSYSTALYASQPSLYYARSSSPYYYHGIGTTLKAQRRWGPVVAAIRAAYTRYSNRNAIGTAERRITGNQQLDLACELRFLF